MAAHVLVVDDDVLNRTIVERMLKALSCSVTTSESAVKALEVLGITENQDSNCNKKFDAVISDFVMPGLTGFDLLQRVKASALRNLPVIIMSSENFQERVNRCLGEGAEMFLVKPLKSDILKAFIEKLNSKRRDETPSESQACLHL